VAAAEQRGPTSNIERHSVFNTPVEAREARLAIAMPKLRMVLYAPDRETWRRWLRAIRYASARRFEDHYAMLETPAIGKGSFGAVREGYELLTMDHVAIKTIEKKQCSRTELEQAQREAEILMTVEYPSVVQTHDIFETDTALYIVMELMRDSVDAVIKSTPETGVGEETAREIVLPVLDAVRVLHERGIVHRDIKPENILIKSHIPPWRPKLSDFGSGTFIGDNDQSLNGVAGTAVYLAPEVVTNCRYGRPVDMWAIGVTLYEMITGHTPFDGQSVTDVMRAIRDNRLEFDEEIWDRISPECLKVVNGLLDKDPNSRLTAVEALSMPWLSVDRLENERPVLITARSMHQSPLWTVDESDEDELDDGMSTSSDVHHFSQVRKQSDLFASAKTSRDYSRVSLQSVDSLSHMDSTCTNNSIAPMASTRRMGLDRFRSEMRSSALRQEDTTQRGRKEEGDSTGISLSARRSQYMRTSLVSTEAEDSRHTELKARGRRGRWRSLSRGPASRSTGSRASKIRDEPGASIGDFENTKSSESHHQGFFERLAARATSGKHPFLSKLHH